MCFAIQYCTSQTVLYVLYLKLQKPYGGENHCFRLSLSSQMTKNSLLKYIFLQNYLLYSCLKTKHMLNKQLKYKSFAY